MRVKDVYFGGNKFITAKETLHFPTKDVAMQPLNKKELKYIWDRFCRVADHTPTIRFNVHVSDSITNERLGTVIKYIPKNVRLPDYLNKELGMTSPLRIYAQKVEGLSIKQKDYCLSCIDEFKPDVEEFINLIIKEVKKEAPKFDPITDW